MTMRFLLSTILIFFISISARAEIISWGTSPSSTYPTLEEAISAANGTAYLVCSNYYNGGQFVNYFAPQVVYHYRKGSATAYPSGVCGTSQSASTYIYRYGSECPQGTVMDEAGQQCVSDSVCAAKIGQPASYFKEYDSLAAYDQNPIRCTTSQDGCAIDVCSETGVPKTCGTSGSTGKFACWGVGTYSGEQLDPTEGGSVDDCAEPCQAPEPTTSDSSQSCTTPTVSNGVTTYSCISESNTDEFASSNCAVGEVQGVQGLHCTSPDYVPESDSNTRTDDVSETSNPDGGKTTTTDSTEQNEHCKAGNCTTSSTSTSTTTTTDGTGKVTGETSTCKGDNCGGKGEEEEEQEPEEFVSPGGGEFGNASDALPAIGEDGDKTYGEATQEYMDRIVDSPIVSSLTNITVPSGGSCSIGSASIFGGSVSFNHFCTMAPDVLSGLRYIFLAIWAWAAIRLFFTA